VLRITLVKSVNRAKEDQLRTVKALGLYKIRDTVEHSDTPQIRGMIKKVSHLLKYEEISESEEISEFEEVSESEEISKIDELSEFEEISKTEEDFEIRRGL
jgi:large subunit ribosomal protein L30